MSTVFQISYTLDVLLYIGCMIDEEKRNLYDEDMNRFMPMLGTISDKYLEKLKKIHQGTPDFINHIVMMLIVNDHLHDWKTADLLDRHKRLVVVLKKAKQFKYAPNELKKFMNGDFSKSMSLIKTIANDLERLEFKKFWLEEKLPLLKERTAQYQKVLSECNMAQHVNGWIEDKKIPVSGGWYMLAYSGDQYQLLLNEFSVVSPIISAEQLFSKVASYALRIAHYQKYCKALKPDASLKAEFKGHELYKTFKKISVYADSCLKMALKVYLMEGCGKASLELSAHYPFATELLVYLRENEKPEGTAVGSYVVAMMKRFSR